MNKEAYQNIMKWLHKNRPSPVSRDVEHFTNLDIESGLNLGEGGVFLATVNDELRKELREVKE